MALVNCKECGKEISSEAGSCPHCGYPQKPANKGDKKKKRGGCGTAIVIIFIFFGVVYLFGQSSVDEAREKADKAVETKKPEKEAPKRNVPMMARVRSTGSAIELEKLNEQDWRGCRIDLNQGWTDSYRFNRNGGKYSVKSGKVLLPLTDFTNRDNERFNIFKYKLDTITISCMDNEPPLETVFVGQFK